MQAMVATSRSISQDKIIQREKKLKYSKHIQMIGEISSHKGNPFLEQAKQSQKMMQTLYRSKSSAKFFQKNQSTVSLKRQNRILLQRIWKVNSSIKNYRDQSDLQYTSGSNWIFKKKQAEAIKEQNKRIASNLVNKRTDVKEYKKKIDQEIKQYLQLKTQIRKVKNISHKSIKSAKNQRPSRHKTHTKKTELNEIKIQNLQKVENEEIEENLATDTQLCKEDFQKQLI